ncbi:flagellin N-terminal helical domain-containing protein [Limnohabitans sp. 103DPR2]|uniref:flagellin N-terminal helical domain-containing protein n=1 Tax=Limnohabitans sp. 103DPR2 TaxID=1678129 RepID=UPI0006DC7ED5|nr:flagellin [Limnohabitans sp. 103DPR2]ALK90938.1 Flagellin [Limnohabitans sp. 103DPR2]
MSTSINTNISALAAQSSLRKTGLTQDTAMERLSTGIRINNAKDDAAGLAISTRMTANIRGISAAIRNANDGISLTQTAEGSLTAIGDNLQRIRELAVQSANTGNNNSDRGALNAEAQQLIKEIDRVANNSAFNGIKLLDGSFQNQSLQVGAGNDANDRISISIGNAKASALGVSSTATVSGSAISTQLTNGLMSINGINVGAALSDGVSDTQSSISGIAVANAINAVSSQTKVTATVAATKLAGTTVDAAGYATAIVDGTVKINGVSIGALDAATSIASRGSQVAGAVNAISDQTGVTATFDTTTGAVALTANDGRNISIIGSAAVAANVTGLGVATATTVSVTRSKVTLSTSDTAGITVGGKAADVLTAAGLATGTTAATVSVGGVASLNLNTAASSQIALSALDTAINTITDARASMGAYQNRLTASIANLETTSMNLQASRSRILDTDYAKETTNLAKSQIITQAATAMLAQANQSAQSVLALLK